ncbi:MAG: hypothetical protein H0S80_02030 [Desulfovibrionaceae bacterium]|nr:hypothetical protein [Desulfovibrionaceae bacterium]
MDITIINPETSLPADRAFAVSMVIRSFKGRRDVEVHLFRPDWDPEEYEGMDWDRLVGDPVNTLSADPEGSKRIILEAFTEDERNTIVEYLKTQYSTRLTAIRSAPLSFPVPAGLTGFTQVRTGKSTGFIEFAKIPSYPLKMPLKGFYDLSLHPPLVEENE